MSSDGPRGPSPPPRWHRFWSERSWKGKTAIIAGAVLLLLIVIGIAVPAPDDSKNTSAEPTTPTTTSAPPTTTEPPQPTTTEEAATTEEASETVDGDTGRMSEGEYDLFTTFDDEFVDEFQDWSSGYAACAQIGLAGDLAGFRDCLDESWSGVEEDALAAYGNAQDTFDDVDNECLSALRTYARQLRSTFVRNQAAYKVARSLDFELMKQAFKKLPRYAQNFADADLAARDACKPT